MQPTNTLRAIIQNASLAVQWEVTSESRPVSAVPTPDGGQQGETMSEFHGRIITTAIMYCVETGQLAVPDGVEKLMAQGVPLQRGNRDGIPGIRLPDGSYTA